MSDEKPLLSIGDDGIKINLVEGQLIETNGDKTFMRGVEYNIYGGKIEHHTEKELIQTGNTIRLTKGGKMLNEVKDGKLTQTDNIIEMADENSTLINKLSPDPSASASTIEKP